MVATCSTPSFAEPTSELIAPQTTPPAPSPEPTETVASTHLSLDAGAAHADGIQSESGTTSTPGPEQPLNAAQPTADDPATPAKNQAHDDLVTDPDCSELKELCYTWFSDVCDSDRADYARRLAADPTIPEEDWTTARLVHYSADGTISSIDPPICVNTADTGSDPPAPVVTGDTVATAFKTIALPVPTARMSPPFPACVHLNLPNYVYVDPIDTDPITVPLLGTPVTVYPRVIDYTWNFGDGTTLTTTDPGAAWPNGTISHVYRKSGRYEVTVTIRWAGDWQTPTHPRSPIPGETTTTSPPGIAWAHEFHVVLLHDPNAVLPTKPHDPADACYQH